MGSPRYADCFTCIKVPIVLLHMAFPQERVRQIEDKALSKLRRPWRQKLLRPHLYAPGSTRDA